MTTPIAEWTDEFLHRRDLQQPDGRALYAYRCTAEEFESLHDRLRQNAEDYRSSRTMRGFVLYAAEWWQRKYDGRGWAWEPLLASIDWNNVSYPKQYGLIRDALRWWNVDLVRLKTSNLYLGTFACQGGLPLALVGDAHSKVSHYLRVVLKHTAAYGAFVEDPIDLAMDQQHLLRPPTLRRDYVFRLAADLTTAVLDLRDDAKGDDPLPALDRTRPDWRQTMPLDLDDERAQELLTGLLREAARTATASVDNFRVERFLRRTGAGWRLGARVRLPASIPLDDFVRQLKIYTPADELPFRLQVRIEGDRVRNLGLYSRSPDDYRLLPITDQSTTEIWDADAASEIRLLFLSGDRLGEGVTPFRGTALGDLPWVFRQDDHDEYVFVGEGSVRNRASELLALVSDDAQLSTDASAEPPRRVDGARILDRQLWEIAAPVNVETESGRCVIKPSSHAPEEDYTLSGDYVHGLEAGCPLFRGEAKLRVGKAGQVFRSVPTDEVAWRQTGSGWRKSPDGYGMWQVRHVRQGELRYLGRAGILPPGFKASIEPGRDMTQGQLVFSGTDGARVAGNGEDVEVAAQDEGGVVRVHVAARDGAPPPRIRLDLHWRGAAPVTVHMPFPGQGGRFLREGQPAGRRLSVDDLYGVRAVALSPNDRGRFRVVGDLRAPDLSSGLVRVVYFGFPLRRSGVTHELALVDARAGIDLLLAASSSIDAHVRLHVMDSAARQHGLVDVHRFAAALRHDVSGARIVMEPALADEPDASVELIPLARPEAEPLSFEGVRSLAEPTGFALPEDLDVDEPWLVVARHGDRVRVRPVALGGRDGGGDAAGSGPVRLREAVSLADRDARASALTEALETMLAADYADRDDAEGVKRDEEEWTFLTEMLLRAADLPATALDLLRLLVGIPRLLVRGLFRLEHAPRRFLWSLETELPFSWLLVPRDVWRAEAARAVARIRSQLADVSAGEQFAADHVRRVLAEGVEWLPGLRTVACDVDLGLEGRDVSESTVQRATDARNGLVQKLLQRLCETDDWPRGPSRVDWMKALEHGQLLGKLGVWQEDDMPKERYHLFDTPVAAAWCCFFCKPTPRTTFITKRIRAHEPEWFDASYAAAWFKLAYFQRAIQERSGR